MKRPLFSGCRSGIAFPGLAVGLVIFSQARDLGAQCYPIGRPPWTNSVVQTVGGITYLTQECWLHDCNQVAGGPVAQSGTNLSQTISAYHCVPCIACFDCYHVETYVSVLGGLAPGDYRLYVSCEGGFPPNPWPSMLPFSVPTNTSSTLTVVADTPATNFQFQVAGVPGAKYIIEASSDFTNWLPIHTNIGAPFTFRLPIDSTVSDQFYRAQIEQIDF